MIVRRRSTKQHGTTLAAFEEKIQTAVTFLQLTHSAPLLFALGLIASTLNLKPQTSLTENAQLRSSTTYAAADTNKDGVVSPQEAAIYAISHPTASAAESAKTDPSKFLDCHKVSDYYKIKLKECPEMKDRFEVSGSAS